MGITNTTHMIHPTPPWSVASRIPATLYPLRAAPVTEPPKLPPPAPKPNAVVYPTLAALGFIFPDGVAVGDVLTPAQRCPTCGHECAGTVKR